ncbi:uncharacterized protein LOC5517643 isoform X2 [Nematostella vectensis]|uniref:uncharacterized protein LOC5517643 isoform X2 n=1 Tax=Nematostella vectensis TaxID=45351 RepID=UPI0013903696|nr:uncharacterized protein LOC5517643 isoform X2 [Nematostella vectensis]
MDCLVRKLHEFDLRQILIKNVAARLGFLWYTNMADKNIKAKRTVAMPVDGSQRSKDAFIWFCKHIIQEGDHVLLIHVWFVPSFNHDRLTWPAIKGPYEDWMYDKRVAEDSVDEMLDWYISCNKNVSKSINKIPLNHGADKKTQCEEICKAAKEHSADMMVMSHKGDTTNADPGVLGLTTDYCVCNAGIPVCVLYLPCSFVPISRCEN